MAEKFRVKAKSAEDPGTPFYLVENLKQPVENSLLFWGKPGETLGKGYVLAGEIPFQR